MTSGHDTTALRNGALAVVALGAVIAGLVYGRSFLIPLAIAIFLWSVLESTILGFMGLGLPRWVATILALGTVGFALFLVTFVLLGQVDAIASAWPRYLARLETIVSDLTEWLGPERSAKLREAVAGIDLTRQVPTLIASTQSIVVSVLIVAAYVGFMFTERGYLQQKIANMFPDKRRAQEATALLDTISESVRRYIWLKTIISILTGVACYIVLRWLGIDFAETWALLIFVLNYIPNIGSIIGVTFPALLAILQFDTLGPFVILVLALTAIQLAIGSVLEPLLMGSSLNMSPLAIIVGLAFWGAVWGIVGMFLSVPILVVVLIVCAHVPSWRWVAILLSRDGRVAT